MYKRQAWEVQPQDKNFDYFRLVLDIYRGLRKQGYRKIDILPLNTSDFGDRKAVFIPGLFAWSDALKTAMQNFKGTIIIGPRTGSRTEDFQIPPNLPPNLDGIKVTAIDTLREDSPLPLAKGGALQIWSEHLETSWKVLETTAQGRAAVVQSGNLQYWAGWPNEEALDIWLGKL